MNRKKTKWAGRLREEETEEYGKEKGEDQKGSVREGEKPKEKIRKLANAFFCGAFGNVLLAEPLLKAILPQAVVDALDFGSLSIETVQGINSASDENAHDIVYSIAWKDSEQRVSLFLALEHQSRPDYYMAFRMFGYSQLILRKYHDEMPKGGKKLPLVIPVVVYIGKRKWNAPKKLRELQVGPEFVMEMLRDVLPECGYYLVDLNQKERGRKRAERNFCRRNRCRERF